MHLKLIRWFLRALILENDLKYFYFKFVDNVKNLGALYNELLRFRKPVAHLTQSAV